MDSHEFILFIVIWERILQATGTASRELKSPNLDLTVAFRLLRCSISGLRVLRGSLDSVKQIASALDSAWHKVVDFKTKTRKSITGAFDDDMINNPEQAFKVNVFFRTVATALMQLKGSFSVQQLVTSTFGILFPNHLARASNEEISKELSNLLCLHSKYFTEDLESELRAFSNDFREEIKEKTASVDLIDSMFENRVSSSCPQVYKALFLFPTIPDPVARSMMAQERLLDVSILSIGQDECPQI